MRLYSVTRYGDSFAEKKTQWAKTQKEAKALKAAWLKDSPKADVKMMQREVPTSKDALLAWLNHHVDGLPRAG